MHYNDKSKIMCLEISPTFSLHWFHFIDCMRWLTGLIEQLLGCVADALLWSWQGMWHAHSGRPTQWYQHFKVGSDLHQNKLPRKNWMEMWLPRVNIDTQDIWQSPNWLDNQTWSGHLPFLWRTGYLIDTWSPNRSSLIVRFTSVVIMWPILDTLDSHCLVW